MLLLGAIGAVLLAGVLVLIFGPARGARDDIAAVRGDLRGSHIGIDRTLDTQRMALRRLTAQLATLRQSLRVQSAALHTARHTGRGVEAILEQARQTQQTTALILRQAQLTLAQLEQSRNLQSQLLDVARQTLQQTRQINHKLP
jgi:hypothetical protein